MQSVFWTHFALCSQCKRLPTSGVRGLYPTCHHASPRIPSPSHTHTHPHPLVSHVRITLSHTLALRQVGGNRLQRRSSTPAVGGRQGAASHKVAHAPAHASASRQACSHHVCCSSDPLLARGFGSRGHVLALYFASPSYHTSLPNAQSLSQSPVKSRSHRCFLLVSRCQTRIVFAILSSPAQAPLAALHVLLGLVVWESGRSFFGCDGEDELRDPRGPRHRLATSVVGDLDWRVLEQRRQPVKPVAASGSQ